MVANLRRSGQQVGRVVIEYEEYNEPSEERGRRRDSETCAANESKTSLALARQDMLVYMREEGRTVRDHPATGLTEDELTSSSCNDTLSRAGQLKSGGHKHGTSVTLRNLLHTKLVHKISRCKEEITVRVLQYLSFRLPLF